MSKRKIGAADEAALLEPENPKRVSRRSIATAPTDDEASVASATRSARKKRVSAASDDEAPPSTVKKSRSRLAPVEEGAATASKTRRSRTRKEGEDDASVASVVESVTSEVSRSRGRRTKLGEVIYEEEESVALPLTQQPQPPALPAPSSPTPKKLPAPLPAVHNVPAVSAPVSIPAPAPVAFQPLPVGRVEDKAAKATPIIYPAASPASSSIYSAPCDKVKEDELVIIWKQCVRALSICVGTIGPVFAVAIVASSVAGLLTKSQATAALALTYLLLLLLIMSSYAVAIVPFVLVGKIVKSSFFDDGADVDTYIRFLLFFFIILSGAVCVLAQIV
eukprot:gene8811-9715_t